MHRTNRVPRNHPAHEQADEWLSRMDELDYPSFEEVAGRAQLTVPELATVRDVLDEAAEDRVRRLPPPWHSGTVRAALRMLAYLGSVPNVTGPLVRFARDGLFGRHVELTALETRDGFRLYSKDRAELFSRIFEMELMSFFASSGFDVELKEGRGPDFTLHTQGITTDVEAKAVEIDRATDIILPGSSWEAICKRHGQLDEQPVEVDPNEVAAALTKTAVGLYDKAIGQCQDSDRYLVAIKFPIEIDFYSAALDADIDRWIEEWTERPSMLGLLLMHPQWRELQQSATWVESQARPSLNELLPQGSIEDLPEFLTRFSEDRTTAE